MKEYDLIIIGAGPAGLTAGIYAGRYLLNTLIIGRLPGGVMSEAYEICNFPSYTSISGMDLMQKIIEQVKSLNVEIKQEEVKEIRKNGFFEVKTRNSSYKAKKIILAVGRKKRKLNVPGEEKFLGRGVSYCSTCDAGFFKDKIVSVVGGSDSALTSAVLLSKYAKKVYIIYRREKFFRAEPMWVEQVKKNKKIECLFNSEIVKICGKERVEEVELSSGKKLKVDGVFIEIGYIPNEEIPKQLGLKTENRYVVANKKQETNIPGVFAVGDITNNPLKQIITACGEGAVAAASAYKEIMKQENKFNAEK